MDNEEVEETLARITKQLDIVKQLYLKCSELDNENDEFYDVLSDFQGRVQDLEDEVSYLFDVLQT
jgi:hypothetical protein